MIIGVIASLIIIFSGALGRLFTAKIREANSFYLSLISFCDYLLASINFSQVKLKEVFLKFNGSNNKFKNFLSQAQNHFEDQNFSLCIPNFLDETQQDEITRFLISLTQFDAAGVTNQIESFKARFKIYQSNYEAQVKVKAPLIEKLSIGVGLVIAILII